MADILDVIRSRTSIRHYTADPIPQDMIMKILEAGRWAPTGENYQPWKMLVVRNPETKAAIARLSKIATGSRGTAEYSMNLLQRFDGVKEAKGVAELERQIKFYASGKVSEIPSRAPVVIVAIGDLTLDSPDMPGILRKMSRAICVLLFWRSGRGSVQIAGVDSLESAETVSGVLVFTWPKRAFLLPRRVGPTQTPEAAAFSLEFGRHEWSRRPPRRRDRPRR